MPLLGRVGDGALDYFSFYNKIDNHQFGETLDFLEGEYYEKRRIAAKRVMELILYKFCDGTLQNVQIPDKGILIKMKVFTQNNDQILSQQLLELYQHQMRIFPGVMSSADRRMNLHQLVMLYWDMVLRLQSKVAITLIDILAAACNFNLVSDSLTLQSMVKFAELSNIDGIRIIQNIVSYLVGRIDMRSMEGIYYLLGLLLNTIKLTHLLAPRMHDDKWLKWLPIHREMNQC